MISPFPMDRVSVEDSYISNAFGKEISYLKSYKPDRLLACFRSCAGLAAKDRSYPGWEDTEIRGHTLGHYLKALSQAWTSTKDGEILARLNYMIEELALCQRDDGYLFASEESLFACVEEQKPAWVPWYTMHKILAGLTACFEATAIGKALDTASRLGDWIYGRTASWSEEMHRRVLAIEYGGMNDGLYDLYRLTGREEHLKAARAFDELTLWEPLRRGEDILRGKHANTTIPKILGALNRFTLTGDKEALETAVRFWDMVVFHHSYITGGNSEWEHFGKPDILDGDRSQYTCETCNTYNMLKLTRGLFMVTGEKKYADFYERTYINAILSSQNPETGMTMYFQPMAAGYFKVYSSPFEHFWCCTGTGMESFSKLNDSLYFHGGDRLYVNMFFSSRLDWKERGMRIIQKTDLPRTDRVEIAIASPEPQEEQSTICLRIPSWVSAEPELTVNGEAADFSRDGGYAAISRVWKNGDRIVLRLRAEVSCRTLPDNGRAAAFQYGPLVLSAALGREDLSLSRTGVMVDVPTREMVMKDFITLSDETPEEWLSRIGENLVREGDDLTFRLKNTEEDDTLLFTPHFRQYEERYGLYWNIVTKDSEEIQNHLLRRKKAAQLTDATVDSLPVGNDQYELIHYIEGEKTYAGTWDGYSYRCADKGGWFRYVLDVLPGEETLLLVKYFDFDRDRPVIITIDDELTFREECDFPRVRGFHDRIYPIPRSLTEGKKQVTVTFRAEEEKKSAGIYHIIRTVRTPSSDSRLATLAVDGAYLNEPFRPEKRDCVLTVEEGTPAFRLNLTPASKNALVRVDGIVIDDTQAREVPLAPEKKQVEITVTAEDGDTERIYVLNW